MSSTPSLSVAMCTWNGARFLPEMLESLLAQRVAADEIVVGDDDSGDDTPRILEQFARRSSIPVRVHRNVARVGCNANFSATLARCRGDLIALADQDDVWWPNKVEQLQLAMRSGAVFAFSDAVVVDENGAPSGYNLWEAVRVDPVHLEALAAGFGFEVLLETRIVTGCCSMISAELLRWVLPIPELQPPLGKKPLPHDAWLALCASAAGPIAVVREPLMSYRRHAWQAIGVHDPTVASTRRPPDPPDAATQARWTGQVLDLLTTRGARLVTPGVGAARQHAGTPMPGTSTTTG